MRSYRICPNEIGSCKVRTNKVRPNTLRSNKLRRGHLIFAVLVCLSVISLILIGALTHGLRLHRQIRNERMLEQTRWVLDAGISRAIIALDNDPNYSGETIELKQTLHDHKSMLKISVDRPATGSSPEQLIFVNVVAVIERVAKTAADPAYQRSMRFEYFPRAITIFDDLGN